MQISRRKFLKNISTVFLAGLVSSQYLKKLTYATPQTAKRFLVNDMHTGLNLTYVRQIVSVKSKQDIVRVIQQAKAQKLKICIAGARHSAGGQQFKTDGVLIDIRQLNHILNYDPQWQLITVESGCVWPQIMDYLHTVQAYQPQQYSIRQKPTGSDEITLGGSLGTNIHGRGLTYAPLIEDIESITVIDADGQAHVCSRTQNHDLFRRAIGGYGLFGFIYSVQIRLVPRLKIQRHVAFIPITQVIAAYRHAVADGCVYGDYEFSMDEQSPGFMKDGFFLSYKPVDNSVPVTADIPDVALAQYNLTYLVHVDKAKAYQLYADHHRNTEGQVFWSDNHQLGAYVNHYHQMIDEKLHAKTPASEAILEVFIPHDRLVDFFEKVRADFLQYQVNLIYGTIRFIKQDTETAMPWAKGDFACVIFNLHVVHDAVGLTAIKRHIQRLIDHVIDCTGTFYLTYEPYATKAQVEACYPEFPEMLQKKLQDDPNEVFESNWYDHYKTLFSKTV